MLLSFPSPVFMVTWITWPHHVLCVWIIEVLFCCPWVSKVRMEGKKKPNPNPTTHVAFVFCSYSLSVKKECVLRLQLLSRVGRKQNGTWRMLVWLGCPDLTVAGRALCDCVPLWMPMSSPCATTETTQVGIPLVPPSPDMQTSHWAWGKFALHLILHTSWSNFRNRLYFCSGGYYCNVLSLSSPHFPPWWVLLLSAETFGSVAVCSATVHWPRTRAKQWFTEDMLWLLCLLDKGCCGASPLVCRGCVGAVGIVPPTLDFAQAFFAQRTSFALCITLRLCAMIAYRDVS